MGFKLYSEEFKKKVVDAYKSGMMIKEVADMYNVSKSSVSCWVKGIKPCERKLFTVEQKKEFVKCRIKNNIPYDDSRKEIYDKYEKMLNILVKEYINEIGENPTFFKVENVKEIVIKEGDDQDGTND